MTRSQDILLQRTLSMAIILLFVVACGIFAMSFAPAESQLEIPKFKTGNKPVENSAPVQLDPELEALAHKRMTRKVAPVANQAAKAVAPDLATLVRVRGIMAYGDPKDNEAIIETMRTNTTRSYKAGDKISDVEATIQKVESTVTFNYDGKQVQLGMQSNERAGVNSIAQPTVQDSNIATGK